ncbi:type II secretion system F family protein [Blautia difficilis]|uniref:Type II secretion system F family protein n=1 Tax=Blautia difficilis TaxID=2763027 RepID=A0ABR7IFK1_9FIRM|nr:type II secretion system F family protein [Blautia difficilis]MBC5778796.1 type II secretion system F family protein [Blautia difficilis]
MPGFSYVAVDKRGKEKRGSLEAETRERALEQLKAEGLIPVSVREQGALNKEIDFSIGKKVKPRDLSVFCRQFVSITQAGVPMKEALQMLSEQTENKWLKRAISEVLLNVEKGNTLADSMRSQPDIFPPMLVNMVEAGEQSGSLEMAFSRMAVHFEKEAKLKATIKKATIYPIILVIAAIGVIAVMLLFVIPIFIDMFADLDIEMPAITMFVMNSSKWMTSHWYVVLAIIVGVVAAYKLIYRTTQGRLTIDRIKMKMPLFGKLTVKTACSQFARTMSTLLMSGISTIDALETTSKIVNNIHYTNAMLKAREEVMKGVPLSEPLEASGIFPPMVYHMTGIGEETGNVEEMLEKMADYYDEEVEMTTQSVLAAMEPIIILFMALIIGTLVIAVISPIASMYNGLDNL